MHSDGSGPIDNGRQAEHHTGGTQIKRQSAKGKHGKTEKIRTNEARHQLCMGNVCACVRMRIGKSPSKYVYSVGFLSAAFQV